MRNTHNPRIATLPHQGLRVLLCVLAGRELVGFRVAPVQRPSCLCAGGVVLFSEAQ